jgi:hypothetical protein
MNPDCACRKYADIELLRSAIDQRISATRILRKTLRLLTESPDKLKKLYECDVCRQLWQEDRAWGWDNWEEPLYLFKVPVISPDEWLQEQYIQPHELLVFNASIERVLKNVREKDEPCAVKGCTAKAIVGSMNCLPHHVQSLQKVGLLPQGPKGRWFHPYSEQPFGLKR